MLNRDYERIRAILKEEMMVIMQQHHDLMDKLYQTEKLLKKAWKNEEIQEKIIAELSECIESHETHLT
jgi:hypothetical protein